MVLPTNPRTTIDGPSGPLVLEVLASDGSRADWPEKRAALNAPSAFRSPVRRCCQRRGGAPSASSSKPGSRMKTLLRRNPTSNAYGSMLCYYTPEGMGRWGGTPKPKMCGEIGAREKLSAPWAIPGATWPTSGGGASTLTPTSSGPRRLSSGGRARQEIAVQDEH